MVTSKQIEQTKSKHTENKQLKRVGLLAVRQNISHLFSQNSKDKIVPSECALKNDTFV